MIEIFVMHALFASSIPISKVLLKFAAPIFLAGSRMFVAGIILLGFYFWRGAQKISFQRKYTWLYVQNIVIGVYLKYVLRYWGLNYMPAAKMSFLLCITPFCAAFFSYLVFNERLSWKQMIGLCLGFVGLMPIIMIKSSGEELIGSFLVFSWPTLAIFGGILCHTYGLTLARKMVREGNHSISMTNGLRMFGGGLLALITSFFIEGSVSITDPVSFVGWLSVLLLVSNIVCHGLYLHLLKKYTATFVSFAGFLNHLFSAFFGWLFLKEVITWHYFVAAVIVFVGLYIFYQDELRDSVTVKEKPTPKEVGPRIASQPTVAWSAKSKSQ